MEISVIFFFLSVFFAVFFSSSSVAVEWLFFIPVCRQALWERKTTHTNRRKSEPFVFLFLFHFVADSLPIFVVLAKGVLTEEHL